MTPNPAAQDLGYYIAQKLGFKVSRAAASLPASTAGALFTISGGRVAIFAIVGEVTTAIQNQANNTKLTANPTTGASVDICAALDIDNDAILSLYSITGTFTDALQGGAPGAVALQAKPFIVPEGTIDLDCAATNTGAIKWDLWYMPIDEGAAVVAA